MEVLGVAVSVQKWVRVARASSAAGGTPLPIRFRNRGRGLCRGAQDGGVRGLDKLPSTARFTTWLVTCSGTAGRRRVRRSYSNG